MNLKYKIAVLIAGLALGATPALATAHGKSHSSTTTTTTSKAKKYGKLCQGETKKHVSGMKGTPFSQCVTAAAHMANGSATNPRSACKAESKKHVSGMKGTPFSECVTAAAKARKSGTGTTTGTTTTTSTTSTTGTTGTTGTTT